MTLVEVLAGAALLGTLLAAILMADARCQRQTAAARARLAACRAAETLLNEWWSDGETMPRDAAGRVAGEGDPRWRTETVANGGAGRLGLDVVRLTVWHGDDVSRKGSIHVDVVAPGEPGQSGKMARGQEGKETDGHELPE